MIDSAHSTNRLIDYQGVNICQKELCILEHVDFHLDAGEFVYLVGKVGSGKTTLLKTFYAELDIQCGEASVLGYDMRHIKRKHIPALRRKMGIVFQDFQLLIDRTITDNLDFVLRATGWKNKLARLERIAEVLEMVGMSTKGYKFPHELSGGEQQRIVIARALLNNPSVILADEPTGNLDTETGHRIVELLHDISTRGTAVVMTTHNLQLLEEYPGIVYRCVDHRLEEVVKGESKKMNTPISDEKETNEEETKE